jgi:hypothetical protein
MIKLAWNLTVIDTKGMLCQIGMLNGLQQLREVGISLAILAEGTDSQSKNSTCKFPFSAIFDWLSWFSLEIVILCREIGLAL